MSDKWETVGPAKKPRKPKPPPQIIGNGTVGAAVVLPPGMSKPVKPKKHSAKIPASFPLAEIDESIPDTIHLGGGDGANFAQKKTENKQKKKTQQVDKPKEKGQKRRDLPGTLANLSPSELQAFFGELQNAGSAEDVSLSWIKYSADALNTKLNQAQVLPPDASQWPNDINFPHLPSSWENAIRTIISQTVQARDDMTDVLGVSYSSILAFIPTLVQRGDPGWGYLIFLRELCRVDPSLPIRRMKTFVELMESYGNRREIGLSVLWTVAQAGVESPYVLKIATEYLLPYYGFKHYKQFVLAALSTITSSSTMAVEYLIEGDEFEEFFEAAFDPKKKRDLEKIYPRVKELALKGLKGKGQSGSIFLSFLKKAGDKDFSPLSPYGKEVFEVMLGCIESCPSCIDTWRSNLAGYPKESAAFLSHLSKVPETVKCGKLLETKLIQSDEFAVTAVKNPELLRYAKKVQAGLDRVAKSKRRLFSWKLAIFAIFLLMGGLLWLDVTENGKGTFEKSNTGKFLQKYGVLKETVLAWNAAAAAVKVVQEYVILLFRSFYEGIQPVLQDIKLKFKEYIPQVTEYVTIVGDLLANWTAAFINFLQTTVFVGPLSPENLRKLTKDSLSFIWSNIVFGVEKMYTLIEQYILQSQSSTSTSTSSPR